MLSGFAEAVGTKSQKSGSNDDASFVGRLRHRHFLKRLVAVPRGELSSRLRNLKTPPNMCNPHKVTEALFKPWARKDDTDGFRWDPEEEEEEEEEEVSRVFRSAPERPARSSWCKSDTMRE